MIFITFIGFSESGIDSLKNDCDVDLSMKRLSEIFHISGSRTHYPWLSSDHGILPYAQKFYTMTVDLKSKIFFQIWKDSLQKVTSGKSVLEGVKKVWEASIDHSEKLIDKKLSIKLTEIDRLFQCIDSSQIEKELTAFCQGICKFKNIGSCQWVSNTARRIQFHRSFHDYVKTAETLLEMKRCLNLTGDFAEMDELVDQVLLHGDLGYCCQVLKYRKESLVPMQGSTVCTCTKVYGEMSANVTLKRAESYDMEK